MTLPYSPSCCVFQGNGIVVNFPFNFKVWDIAQLQVLLTDPDGVVSTAAWSAELGDAGGTVNCAPGGAPLPEGWTLTVLRDMPFTQGVDLHSGSRFDPQVIEDELDRATAERQQLREAVTRAVKISPGSGESPDALVNAVRSGAREAVRAAEAAAVSQAAAASSEASATGSETAAAASAARARAWAESADSPDPDDAGSKSARTWAEQAGQDVSGAVAQVEAAGDAQAARLETLGAVFPGCVAMFSGTFGGSDGKRPIPVGGDTALEGWALCDGTNGTPDLRGCFIVGAGGTYTAGDAGGAATHAHTTGATTAGYTTLDGNTLPSHNHPGYWRTVYGGGGGNGGLTVEGEPGNQWRDPVTHNRGNSWGHTHSLPAVGTTAASSLPPYYALAFIMKLPGGA